MIADAIWSLARFLPKFRKPPMSSAAARAMLFPDYELSDQSKTLFDPFTLRLQNIQASDIKAEVDLIGQGQFDAARAIVSKKASDLTGSVRIRYMFDVTAGIHELRHFHDHFGTTFGFERVKQRIHDARAFAAMWQALRAGREIKLPLAAWASEPDAPAPLRDYMSQRRRFVEWFNVHDAAQLPAKSGRYATFPEPADPHIMLAYDLKDLKAVVPTVLLRNGRGQRAIVPMGGYILMEGSAFIVQRHLATHLFGAGAHETMIKWMQTPARHDPDRIEKMFPYMAIDLYLSKKMGRFFDRYQLAVTDAAMMPGRDQRSPDDHPGFRMTRLVATAKSQPNRKYLSDTNLSNAMRELTRSIGWPYPRFVAQQAVEDCEKGLKELEALDPRDGWYHILRALLRLHLEFMRLRVKFPDLLADPDRYLHSHCALLPAPISWDGHTLQFQGFTEDLPGLQHWYFFAHMQHALLFTKRMPCASLGHPHDCPGDPWLVSGWAPRETCPFSQFIAKQGVLDRRPMFIGGVRT